MDALHAYHGDEDFKELTPAEQILVEQEATRLVRNRLASAAWWSEQMDGETAFDEVAATIARCMSNLDAACNGDRIALDGITTALHNLQKTAKLMTVGDAREQAEHDLAEGLL